MTREARVTAAVLVILVMSAAAFILGWHTSAAGLAVSAVMLAAAYFLIIFRPARIPRGSLLRVRLAGGLHEYSIGSLMDRLRGRDFVTMHHLRDAIGWASRDPSIAAVMVEIAGVSCGMAAAQELHDLLAAAGRGGKRTIAVLEADAAGPREYLIAAGAGEIVANPDIALMMLGVSAGSLFLKGALDHLHVGAQSLQWKEYKGAAEVFSREEMSPEVRASVEAVITDWEQVLVEYLARSRRLDSARARELLGAGFLSARQGCDCGLIDRIGHSQDILAEFQASDEPPPQPLLTRLLQRRAKGERTQPHVDRVVGLNRYLWRINYLEDRGRRPRIALVYGLGPVIAGEPPMTGEFISGPQTAGELMRAARDPRVRAVLFRVNSPGGSAVGSDLVWRAVTEVRRRGKPVVVSMGDVAGSGGYYVAMAADSIVAQPSTITGSIGVVYTKFNLGELLRRAGINLDFVKSSPMADALAPNRPLTAVELEQLNRVMGELYQTFVTKVAQGRKLDQARAEELARGRIWSGTAALSNGLVDTLGGIDRALELARDKAGLKPGQDCQIAVYSPMRGLMGLRAMLVPTGAGNWMARPLAGLTGVPERWLPALADLLSRSGAALLCPWF